MNNQSSRAYETVTTEFNYFQGEDGAYVVHLPTMGYAFKVSADSADVLAALKEQRVLTPQALEKPVVGQLRGLEAFGKVQRRRPTTQAISSFKPTEATLLFTETCNLGCSYCYASSMPSKSAPMPWEVARASVDLALKNGLEAKRPGASLRYIGGGEPTIEWDLLQRTTAYARSESERLNVPLFIRLITNGTLLSDQRVEWLSKNIDFVTLSFDILPDLQNTNRPFAGGRESQGRMLKIVRRLSDAGIKFHLRTTISSEGAGRLPEMVEYAHEHTGATSIRFEPMSEIGRVTEHRVTLDEQLFKRIESVASQSAKSSPRIEAQKTSNDFTKPSERQFIESFKEAYLLGRELGIDVTCKMFANYLRRSSRFCDIEFSVAPTGVVSGCHRYSRPDHDGMELFGIGRYDDGEFVFDIDKINSLRFIDNDHFEDCKTCDARWNCASGCLSARLSTQGISKQGPLCHLTRELLKFGVEQHISNQ